MEKSIESIKEGEMGRRKVKNFLRISALVLVLLGGWRFYEKDVLLGFILFVIAWIIYVFQDELSKSFG